MNRTARVLRVARPGKPLRWYVYAWRGGPLIRVATQPKRPKLTAADHTATAEALAADRTLPADTVEGAIAAFRRSKYWRKDLSDGTRKTWGHGLDRIEAKWGKLKLHILTDPRMKPKIVKWRDTMENTPRTADLSVYVLSRWLAWCVLEGLAIHNPAANIPTIDRGENRAAVIWLPADLAAISEHAMPALQDALDLAELTGLRRADLVALRWEEVGDLAIRRTAAKKSRGRRYRVTMPRLPALDALLERLKARPRKAGVETVLVNSFGKSWTGDGLNSSFSDARGKANGGTGIWHVERDPTTGEDIRTQKRLHDFRGTYATHLMTHPTARLTDREIADLMGWDEKHVAEIRRRYVDDSAIVVALTRRLADTGTG